MSIRFSLACRLFDLVYLLLMATLFYHGQPEGIEFRSFPLLDSKLRFPTPKG